MADIETREVQLVARFVPADRSGPFATMAEAQAAGHDTLNPLTGTYQVGVEDQGAFLVFFEEAWAAVSPLIDAAKVAKAEADAAATTGTTETTV